MVSRFSGHRDGALVTIDDSECRNEPVPRLGVILQGGLVVSVVTTDHGLVGTEAVVVDDGKPQKLVRVREDLERAITTYCAAARDMSRAFLIGTACEVTSDALLELSRLEGLSARGLLQRVKAVVMQLEGACSDAFAV